MKASDVVKALVERPLRFAVVTIVVYTLLLLPIAASRHFDLSVFVFAGNEFVSESTAPITIVSKSIGYDGQFFYRFALNPFSAERSAYGITLDTPAKRMQRIGYPMLAWFVSLGQVGFVPGSLLAINLIGLGGIAACTAWITRRDAFAWWLPIAITAWPGFLVSLTHDTAEITSAALLLTALAFYLSDRLWAYCTLAAASALTRETTIPILLGLLAYETYVAATSRTTVRWLSRVAPCALAFVPFGVWWMAVSSIWHQAPQSLSGSPDLGWPLVGGFSMLTANLNGTRIWTIDPTRDLVIRTYVILTTCGLLGFCLAVAMRIPRLTRVPELRGLVVGWLLVVVLMSMLTAEGPWIAPLGYFRAFTECWVIGCLLLAHGPPNRTAAKSIIWVTTIVAVEVNMVIWVWAF